MGIKDISPDQVLYFVWGFIKINATIAFTWGVMLLLVIVAVIATRNISPNTAPSRWQNFLEVVVAQIRSQIREISHQEPAIYLPFVGTLFLFIATCNLLAVVPWFIPPTASLSTTAALAICVFVSVFIYGIAKKGPKNYFLQYIKPTPLMLPFNILGELSRTLALAVRLFGNIMSGAKIAAILLAIAPLLFPVVMNALGLLTGMIQAYIFAVLAMVYIASATRQQQAENEDNQ